MLTGNLVVVVVLVGVMVFSIDDGANGGDGGGRVVIVNARWCEQRTEVVVRRQGNPC